MTDGPVRWSVAYILHRPCLRRPPARLPPQEFTSDMNSRAVKRIEDVMLLRASQVRRGVSGH